MSVIRLVGLIHGEPTAVDGWYVKHYDPSGNDGRGDLVATPKRADAFEYETAIAALEAWREVSATHPVRPDGQPNRPLTAWTVQVDP